MRKILLLENVGMVTLYLLYIDQKFSLVLSNFQIF
jgi:hypothetical protein